MTKGATWCRTEEQEHKLGGDPVLMVCESETCYSSFTCSLLSDRKSVIQLQVESGMLSRESFSCSSAGMMVLKAEQTGSWHRFQGIPDAGRCTGGPCTVHSIVYRPVGSGGELQGVQ